MKTLLQLLVRPQCKNAGILPPIQFLREIDVYYAYEDICRCMILVLYFLFVLNYSLLCSHEKRFKRNEYILISLFLKKVLLTLIVRKLLCDVKKNSALEVETLLRSKP